MSNIHLEMVTLCAALMAFCAQPHLWKASTRLLSRPIKRLLVSDLRLKLVQVFIHTRGIQPVRSRPLVRDREAMRTFFRVMGCEWPARQIGAGAH